LRLAKKIAAFFFGGAKRRSKKPEKLETLIWAEWSMTAAGHRARVNAHVC